MRSTHAERTDVKASAAAPAVKPTAGAMSLAEAIRVFNARAAENPIGKSQPPLTEEEVIAAIRWSLLEIDKLAVSDKTIQTLRRTIDSRELPRGFELEVLTDFEPNDRMEVTMWSVRAAHTRPAARNYVHQHSGADGWFAIVWRRGKEGHR